MTLQPIKKPLWVFLAALLLLWSCRGQKQGEPDANVLVGTVYVTGNEPFTTLAIRADDGSVRLLKKDTTEVFNALWKQQGKMVRVRFRPTVGSGDSVHVVIERFDLVKE